MPKNSTLISEIDTHFDTWVEELKIFLTFPSVSTSPEHKKDVRACAEHTLDLMKQSGLHKAKIFETNGHPICFGQTNIDPNKPTLLIYGHYDVQPPEPLDLWESGPFQPTIKHGQIIARGASDDKGQVMCHLKALQTYIEAGIELSVNVKCLIEGEEEIGSPNLGPFVENYKELLACDAIVISDTPMLKKGVPSICTSLRGLVYTQLDVETASTDLHSGQHGGPAPNAIDHLQRILGKLKDENGSIQIPNFYDDIPALPQQTKNQLASLSPSDEEYKQSSGVFKVDGDPEFSIYEKQWYRPTLDINGIWGGFTGQGAKTVIPRKAHAKISMRLVGKQNPTKIFKAVKDYVASVTPDGIKATLNEISHPGEPFHANQSSPVIQAAVSAIEEVFGKKPVFQGEGGSIPIVTELESQLNAPVVLLGFNLPEDKIHAPNEQFGLENFKNGIKVSALFYNYLATVGKK